jgi:hypothetical protein
VGGADEDVLEHRHRLERMRDLMREGDAGAAARMRRQRSDVAAVEEDPPAIRAKPSGHQVERRRLAGAVRADDADRLVVADRQGEPVENQKAAERPRDLLEREERRRSTPA